MKVFFASGFLGIALACAVSNARAAEADPSKAYTGCMQKAEGVTPDMMDCIQAEIDRLEKAMKMAEQKINKTLSSARHKAFRTAHAAWTKYRDVYCDFKEDPEGGQMARVEGLSCLRELTASHLDELTKLLPPSVDDKMADAIEPFDSEKKSPAPGVTAQLTDEYRQMGGIAAMANLCFGSEAIPKALNAQIQTIVSKHPEATPVMNQLVDEYNAAHTHAVKNGVIWNGSAQSYSRTPLSCKETDTVQAIKKFEASILANLR